MIRSLDFRLPLMFAFFLIAFPAIAEEPGRAGPVGSREPSEAKDVNGHPDAIQAKLDAVLTKMLSGAILEGSFTTTGRESDPTKLSREKYTLGEVKKLNGNLWLFPTRIEYGGKDATLPITVPIEWAGDTPVIVIDELPLPGFGTVSARVMFFADHYAGYWKHGPSGGHLFGTITRDEDQPDALESTKSR